MPRPFVSSDRRVDLASQLAHLRSDGATSSSNMKNPFEKKDSEKKDIEKKDLKETKDSKEQEQYGFDPSEAAARLASSRQTGSDEDVGSALEIGRRWTEKPAKLVEREPPV